MAADHRAKKHDKGARIEASSRIKTIPKLVMAATLNCSQREQIEEFAGEVSPHAA